MMSETSQELQSLPISATFGAGFIGLFLSSIFYGVMFVQAYQYFHGYWKEDSIVLRLLVLFLVALDTLGLLMTMEFMWYFLIENYGNVAALITVHWTLVVFLVVTSLIGFLVQIFYAYRIWILSSRRFWIPAAIITLALACLALGISYIVQLYIIGSMLYIPSITFISTSSLACAFASDALIAGSMVFYLMSGYHHESTEMQKPSSLNKIVKKLLFYTITTGTITTVCTVIALLLGQILINTYYNTIFYFPLNNCYLNSMLAMLNARHALRGVGY